MVGGRLCSKALRVLESILDDDKAPVGARVDACKTLLDRGGGLPSRQVQAIEGPDAYEKPQAEMSAAELHALVAHLEAKRKAEIAEDEGDGATDECGDREAA